MYDLPISFKKRAIFAYYRAFFNDFGIGVLIIAQKVRCVKKISPKINYINVLTKADLSYIIKVMKVIR